jgi:hypothetical protein
MEHGGPVLGPAHTRFNDYIGTVAADDAEAVKGQPSLYDLANIAISTPSWQSTLGGHYDC